MRTVKLVAGLVGAALLASGCETYFDYQRVRVIEAQEDGFLEDGDELILATIDFRVRPGVPGSTQVRFNPDSLDKAATSLEDGDVKTINDAEGLYTFPNVQISSTQSLLQGQAPEIIGQVVIGIENDLTPRSIIRNELQKAEGKVKTILVNAIESRSVTQILNDPNALMTDLAGATGSIKPNTSWFENLLLTLVSLGNKDDILNFNVLFFVPVTPELAPIVDNAFASLPEGFYGGAFPSTVVDGKIPPKQFDLRFFNYETEYIVELWIGPGTTGYVAPPPPPTTEPPYDPNNPCWPDPPPPPNGACN
jgi:hypothetical protein